jgi:ribosomal protein RSM22 (predicted rRNA methylase)
MRLPQLLLDSIRAETGKMERRRVAQAVAQLTERYQAGNFSVPAIANDAQRAAYLAVRFPATYAVNRRIFSELKLRAPEARITTLLDLGAGPGTALFAAAEIFPELERATLIEADEHWIKLGKDLARASSLNQDVQWSKGDLRSGFACDQHDLVVISYVLGELATNAADAVIRKAWSCARQFLVIVEPGTPRGFSTIDGARSALIAAGAAIIAPCPHQRRCPMANVGDSTPERAKAARSAIPDCVTAAQSGSPGSGDPGEWCHFSQRLERTAEHRQLKGGELGYEDEKFSYILAGRQARSAEGARIVRHPRRHSGHIELRLCTPAGQIERKTVTRSDKERFRLARKADWGELWKGGI